MRAVHTTEMAHKLVLVFNYILATPSHFQIKWTINLSLLPDVQCDVCSTTLPEGGLLYCVWMRRPGHQGTLLLTDKSLHDKSGASLGEVCGSISDY